jgi:hypothetical protein
VDQNNHIFNLALIEDKSEQTEKAIACLGTLTG